MVKELALGAPLVQPTITHVAGRHACKYAQEDAQEVPSAFGFKTYCPPNWHAGALGFQQSVTTSAVARGNLEKKKSVKK